MPDPCPEYLGCLRWGLGQGSAVGVTRMGRAPCSEPLLSRLRPAQTCRPRCRKSVLERAVARSLPNKHWCSGSPLSYWTGWPASGLQDGAPCRGFACGGPPRHLLPSGHAEDVCGGSPWLKSSAPKPSRQRECLWPRARSHAQPGTEMQGATRVVPQPCRRGWPSRAPRGLQPAEGQTARCFWYALETVAARSNARTLLRKTDLFSLDRHSHLHCDPPRNLVTMDLHARDWSARSGARVGAKARRHRRKGWLASPPLLPERRTAGA